MNNGGEIVLHRLVNSETNITGLPVITALRIRHSAGFTLLKLTDDHY